MTITVPIHGQRKLHEDFVINDPIFGDMALCDLIDTEVFPIYQPISEIMANPKANVRFESMSLQVVANAPVHISAKISMDIPPRDDTAEIGKISPIEIPLNKLDSNQYSKC